MLTLASTYRVGFLTCAIEKAVLGGGCLGVLPFSPPASPHRRRTCSRCPTPCPWPGYVPVPCWDTSSSQGATPLPWSSLELQASLTWYGSKQGPVAALACGALHRCRLEHDATPRPPHRQVPTCLKRQKRLDESRRKAADAPVVALPRASVARWYGAR